MSSYSFDLEIWIPRLGGGGVGRLLTGKSHRGFREYVAALLQELAFRADDRRWTYRAVRSVTFKLETGAIPGEDLGGIVAAIERTFAVAPGCRIACEFPIESPRHLEGLRAAGIDSVVLPIWSFDGATLRRLGARHDGACGREVLETALRSGFAAVGIKLLFGTAGQTLAQFRTDLSRLIAHPPHEVVFAPAMGAAHFSGRTLAVEQLAKMKGIIEAVMSGLGYTEVHVHRYLRGDVTPSRAEELEESRLGLGVGAQTVTTDGHGRRIVASNHDSVEAYLKAVSRGGGAWRREAPRAPEEELGAAIARMFYEQSGLDLHAIERRFGVDVERACPGLLDVLVDAHFLSRRGSQVALTPVGHVAIDDIVNHFRHGLLPA